MGHLQIASGVAGFIKTGLALYYRQIPATLHFENPNPRIDFANGPFYVNDRLQDWSPAKRPRRAAVNSLGIGGTNAHVVLEEAPPQQQRTGVMRRPHLLPISARSRSALRALIGRYRGALEQFDDASLPDICFTAATGRVHFAERFAAVGATIADIRKSLTAALDHEENGQKERAVGKPRQIRAGLLFSGLGSLCPGMARQLYDAHPRFRETLHRCSEWLANELPQPLLDVLFAADADPSMVERTAFAQPVSFAVEYALAEIWRDWGVAASAVLGHGAGEYAAACVAGVFSLEDGLRLVSARARLMRELPHVSGMAAVMADEARVGGLLQKFPGLSIAAINGPRRVVVVGERTVLNQAL